MTAEQKNQLQAAIRRQAEMYRQDKAAGDTERTLKRAHTLYGIALALDIMGIASECSYDTAEDGTHIITDIGLL